MHAVRTTTFDVTDVVRATRPLAEVPYKKAVEALLTKGRPDWEDDWEDDEDEFPDDRPDPGPPRPVEACSRYGGRLLDKVAFHPLVAAAHHAFMGHRPLRLSPDMIWLAICQGAADHINAHAEELRPRLVRRPGRATISMRRDDFLKGSPENPWPEVFAEFSDQIRSQIGPSIERFVPDFSTTGPAEKAASEIVLLEALQSYFAYELHSFCGIPAVTLEGTPEDWEAVAERAGAFADLGLGWWLDPLGPVLDQFARAARGEVDRPFWRSLYKLHDESGGPKITGWLLALFPYLKDRETGRATVRNPWLAEEAQRIEFDVLGEEDEVAAEPQYLPDGPTMEEFPGGLSSAPLRWECRDRAFAMEFLGGFVGVAQDDETLSLRPEIGWAVREASETDRPG
ncbi:hypothetical protein VT85_22435 [Planctomyces sp. SH-PL62]|nr:hypothetical protein VT85_22435 [Planctomyces sp. SH-PL62]